MTGDYLSALALLKISYDRHGATFLDYVTPFVGDTVRSMNLNEILNHDLQAALFDRYGLKIPERVLNTIVRRLVKRNFGTRSHGYFQPDNRKLRDSYNFDQQRVDCQLAIDALAKTFMIFTKQQINRQLSESEAITALTKYADSNGLPIILGSQRGHDLRNSLNQSETDYITRRFVIHAFENELSEMDTLIMLAKGSKLASVLYLPDPTSATRRIGHLIALIDTPMLLSALGYHGAQGKWTAQEVLDLAFQCGVDLAVFDHTIAEVKSILEGASASITRNRRTLRPFRPVDAHFLEFGYSASDIQLEITRLDRRLRSLRIREIERPPMNIAWSVNEQLFETRVKRIHFENSDAWRHDVDALTATFRLREGRQTTELENARAVFVTPNRSLARVSTKFFNDEFGPHWPIAMTDDAFATLLWLKQPLAAPDLPDHRIVADAYAALNTGLGSWENYVGQFEKLKSDGQLSEDDYFLFKYSSIARKPILNITHGNPSNFTIDIVDEILERIQLSIQRPAREEIEKLESRLLETEATATKREETLASSLIEIQQERDQAIATAETAYRRLETQRWNIRDKTVSSAVRFRRITTWTVITVLLLGVWFSLPPDWEISPDFANHLLLWIARGSVASLLLCGTLSIIFGWHVVGYCNRLEESLSSYLERKALRRVGLEE